MVTDDFERDAPASLREPNTAVRLVLDQVQCRQAFQHIGHRGTLDTEALGDRLRGHPPLLSLEGIDDLEIVLHRVRDRRSSNRSSLLPHWYTPRDPCPLSGALPMSGKVYLERMFEGST